MATLRLGVLLSGTGRTLENLLDYIARGELDCTVACVISDRDGVRGSQVGRDHDIPTFVEPDPTPVFDLLRRHDVDLVCLAGYLRLLRIADDFKDLVLNIHPALLPKFGGKGYHGRRVHEAVLAAGERESGCTVHYCDNEYDRGPILLQKTVPILQGDDADTLAARVFEAECAAYPEAIRLHADRRGQ